jgi:hypothetical protein
VQYAGLDIYSKFLIQEMKNKRHMHFEEDFYSFTALCYLKDNIKRYHLTDEKLSQAFYFLGIIFLVSNVMLIGMFWDFLVDDSYIIHPPKTFRLMIVRFVCSIAMHIMLFPEIKAGMEIMKFSNNHED